MKDNRWEKLLAWEKVECEKIDAQRSEAEKLIGIDRKKAILETLRKRMNLYEKFLRLGYGWTYENGFGGIG